VVEEEMISEDEEGNWANMDRDVSMGKEWNEDEQMDDYHQGLEYIWGDELGSIDQESE
jgi:hypothetical protein